MNRSEKQDNKTKSEHDLYFELLLAVARRKDEAAFSKIYSHIKNKAFSLAYQITRNKELSEEALQDGMLRVWRHASSYEPTGNPRNWILSIVANAAIAALTKQKNAHKVCQNVPLQNIRETDFQQGEQSEIQAELHSFINALPQGQRQILALHFGAGMSQHTIGKTLGMPQRTVSYQFSKTLNLIKSHLKKGGFAALSALNVELESTICNGWQPSAEVQERIRVACSRTTSRAVHETVLHSKQRQAHSRAVIPIVWALGIVATVSITGFLSFQTRTNATETTIPTGAQALNQRWNFKEGPPSDLIPIAGNWHWRAPSKAAPGHMLVPANPGVFFMLPMAIPENPCVVSVRYSRAYFGLVSTQIYWMDGTTRLPFKGWQQSKRSTPGHRQNITVKLYIHENRIYQCSHADQVHTILHFKQRSASREIGLGFCNYTVEEISIREIQAHELPATVREAHKLKTPKFANKVAAHDMKLLDHEQSVNVSWSRNINSSQWTHSKLNTSKQSAQSSIKDRAQIPYYFAPQPHKITLRHAATTTTEHPSLHWYMVDRNAPMPFHIWKNPGKTDTPHASITYFMFDQYVVTCTGKTLISVAEFEIPYPGQHMMLTSKNTFLQKFTVETMKLKDMPHKVQHVEALIQHLKKRGVQAKKHGVFWY